MNQVKSAALFAAFALIFCGLAFALNYHYFSDTELTRFGERVKFWHGDTLAGPVRSNDTIAIMQSPVFLDFVITSAPDFLHGAAYQPIFLGPDPVLNAPRLELPTNADWIRAWAFEQGHYFNPGPFMKARVRIIEDSLRIRYAPQGAPFDTSYETGYHLPDSAVVFFECPVQIHGVVSTVLIFGAAGTVGLEDNLTYISADPVGRAPLGHPERFALIAEGDIKILNTYANGRENSGGRGNNQTHQDSTSIVLDGFYIPLNETFTFENQNDPDSGYVCIPCGCSADGRSGGPDDRGQIFLYGILTQKQRGYTHRSNCTSTGYLKNYRYDETLRRWNVGLFDVPENEVAPLALDFGRVAVGDTAWDSVHVANDFVPAWLDSIRATPPFFTPLSADTFRWRHAIPVAFAPDSEGVFAGTLTFSIPYYHEVREIPLSGVGTGASSAGAFILPPSSFILSASPNPFNSCTRISFALPVPGLVRLGVFDILGRPVATLAEGTLRAGTHEIAFDAQELPSGLYLLHLAAGKQSVTQKLLLLK
jgi:hypothetical protein